ncbi:MAG TPA: tetratricopeptide repeat protein [Vicinamibacterales bacterium]
MPQTRRRLVLSALVLGITATGCAGRRPVVVVPVPPPTADLAAAITHGCYRCLEGAFDLAQTRGARQQAFEAATLLALRSKELGLPHDAWLTRARELAAPDGSSAVALAIADAIPIDPLRDREASLAVAERMRARASLPEWRKGLQEPAGSDAFRAYLDVSLVCSFQGAPDRDAILAAGSWPPVPLLQYRVGVCASTQRGHVTTLQAGDPSYVDADYALGRYALEDSLNPDQDEALRRLQSAAAAFPASPAIATTLGQLHRSREEWAQALAAYDAALAVSPRHADASIGRVISLSNLGRRDEAIDTATRVIEAGQWFLGEAHYWRAWNHLQSGQLALARSDADRTRTLMVNAAVFVLSGLIDWRLRRVDTAEQEFERALAMDFGQCEAAQYLGTVRADRARLPEAIAAFVQARQCYDLSLTLRREALAKTLAGPATGTTRERATERQERAIKDVEGRRQDVMQALQTLERATGTKPSEP